MMKKLNINFTDNKIRQQRRSNFVIATLSAIILLIMMMEYSRMDNERLIAEDKLAVIEGRQTLKQAAKQTAADRRSFELVTTIQQKLNLPWNELLLVLEAAKKQSTKVDLQSIQPNHVKNEVILSGTGADIKEVLHFISLLELQPQLSDVLLVNQTKLEDSEGLTFTLKMRWEV